MIKYNQRKEVKRVKDGKKISLVTAIIQLATAIILLIQSLKKE